MARGGGSIETVMALRFWIIHNDTGKEETHSSANIIEHLTDASGSDAFIGRKPCSRDSWGSGGDHNAGDAIEDGSDVVHQGHVGVTDVRKDQEHASYRSS